MVVESVHPRFEKMVNGATKIILLIANSTSWPCHLSFQETNNELLKGVFENTGPNFMFSAVKLDRLQLRIGLT